jgi:aminoglycoside phosphotransferase (APT) family kinase protein
VPDAPEIDGELVRRLLAEQHPDLAALPVTFAGHGWDNDLFRLGDELVARLPRRVEAAPLVEHELRWLPALVADLPSPADGGLSTSAPVRAGAPGCGYPWSWCISRWLPGDAAVGAPIDDPHDAARRLGRFLRAFHRPAPDDAPANPFRGIPLAARSERLALALAEVAGLGRSLGPGVTADDIERRWSELEATPPWPGPALWLHGDLHLANLIVDDGQLVAVIDFGDLTSGDPATDLAVAWLALPDAARPTLRAEAGDIDDDTWRRAEGWAVALSVSYLAGAPADSPLIAPAQRMLSELLG